MASDCVVPTIEEQPLGGGLGIRRSTFHMGFG